MAADVLYYGNTNTGGTAPVDASNPYDEGTTVTVLGIGDLEKTGYEFVEWNTSADGTGTGYDPLDTFLMPATQVDLYAQWAAVYEVTYDGNGSTGGTAPVDLASPYQEAETVTVLGNTDLVKTDSVFVGWNTASDGSGTDYVADDTFAMGTAAVTLYAQWADSYNVTYDGNTNTGGTVPTDSGEYVEGATVTVLGNTGSLVKTGNVFGGWNTAADGTGTTYAPGATFTMGTADVTLYAIWTDIPDNTVTTKAINASTFTAKRTVTATDVVNGAITFDFQTLRDLAAVVTVVSDAGAVVVADLAVSYPAAGKVRVAGTGLVEDYVVSVFAAINSLDPVWKIS